MPKEQYRVRVTGPDSSIDHLSSEPIYRFTGSEIATLGRGTLVVGVAQLGDLASSHEAVLKLVPKFGEAE